MLNKIRLKIKAIGSIMMCNLFIFTAALNSHTVYAQGFNEGAAKNLAQSYTKPFTSFLLWAIPIGAVIAIVIVVITYLAKTDPDEKEQMKPGKTIKKIVFWSIVGESVSAILAIVGL